MDRPEPGHPPGGRVFPHDRRQTLAQRPVACRRGFLRRGPVLQPQRGHSFHRGAHGPHVSADPARLLRGGRRLVGLCLDRRRRRDRLERPLHQPSGELHPAFHGLLSLRPLQAKNPPLGLAGRAVVLGEHARRFRRRRGAGLPVLRERASGARVRLSAKNRRDGRPGPRASGWPPGGRVRGLPRQSPRRQDLFLRGRGAPVPGQQIHAERHPGMAEPPAEPGDASQRRHHLPGRPARRLRPSDDFQHQENQALPRAVPRLFLLPGPQRAEKPRAARHRRGRLRGNFHQRSPGLFALQARRLALEAEAGDERLPRRAPGGGDRPGREQPLLQAAGASPGLRPGSLVLA